MLDLFHFFATVLPRIRTRSNAAKQIYLSLPMWWLLCCATYEHGGGDRLFPMTPIQLAIEAAKTEPRTQKALANFWHRLLRNDVTCCWEWTGSKTKKGYGKLGLGHQNLMPHRLAYALVFDDPGEELVCHRCDNPPCCNPFHLFKGTYLDNAHDCIDKGRINPPQGVEHFKSKLTTEDVVFMRTSGLPNKALSERFGIRPSTVTNIQKRRLWKHV